MKFQSVEAREYPTLAMTLDAGDVVDLPDNTSVAGLVPVSDKKAAPAAPVVEVSDNGSAPQ